MTYRPHIPWSTRRVVIERQLRAAGIEPTLGEKHTGSDERATRWMIERLFPSEKVELHHRPAICNRDIIGVGVGGRLVFYNPDANDPDYLVYLPVADHDVETRVRGQHGDYSDLALRRKRKRMEKNRARAEAGKYLDRRRRHSNVDNSVRADDAALPVKKRWPKRKWPKKRKMRWSPSRSSSSPSSR